MTECPEELTAEAVAVVDDREPVLLSLRFSVTGLHADDPRRPGDGFVTGGCPCLASALHQLAAVIDGGYLEHLE